MVTMVTMVTMVIRVAMVAGVTRMTRWTIGYNHADEGVLSRLQGGQVGNFQSEKSGGKYDLKIKSLFPSYWCLIFPFIAFFLIILLQRLNKSPQSASSCISICLKYMVDKTKSKKVSWQKCK